ncbi:hypothetical protein VTK73DRAFT_5372 [Phialemonium thermophilum]|uniref:BTB domain-containing protein n=1 Tax=Phialemonium thermophilum TaxID=223376 RepID=A0ABR3XY48_9PEZI
MSLLFKYFYDGDVDKFRSLLYPSRHSPQSTPRTTNAVHLGSSPSAFETSPRPATKSRKQSGWVANLSAARSASLPLSRAEVNTRDHAGLTVLLRAASSTAVNAIDFVRALLEYPATDIYVQDPESGWNCLHRALYAGNISIARLILEIERSHLTGQTLGAPPNRIGLLIKAKDHEGNSPFDLFNSTIGERSVGVSDGVVHSDGDSDSEAGTSYFETSGLTSKRLQEIVEGDELFAFGSNKNRSLGLGDEDDRQFPERVILKRPDHLLQRFYHEHLQENTDGGSHPPTELSSIPTLVLNRPLALQDVVLSKLHSAVLTTDPVSNLYICGVGRGGRLGLGDENTRFSYVPVQGGLAGKKVSQVALGRDHTLAVTDTGELWSWGSNACAQLGYVLPSPAKKDEEPSTCTPRQVFGPLKREMIVGVAASAIHSVAHTGSSLYCWGKNVGQLGLMDADSRSLEFQIVPRKVAAFLFSSPITMVSAIDKATTCLLANHTVLCFTSYGYNIVKFPLTDSLTNYRPRSVSASAHSDSATNHIQYITSGGETVAAVTGRGDLFTFGLSHKVDTNPTTASTTNPSKIKGAVTQPQCIWSARREGVRSVGVGEHGSVIISTDSGAVWRRVERPKAKDAYATAFSESRRKDFKFQRVPYITRAVTVRASAFGAFAAIRRDLDVMRKHIQVEGKTLWDDMMPLYPLCDFRASHVVDQGETMSKAPDSGALQDRIGLVAYEVLQSSDLHADLQQHLEEWSYCNDSLQAVICSSSSPGIKIPIHEWLLSARSPVLRDALSHFRKAGSFEQQDFFQIERCDGAVVIQFIGLDLMSLLNIVHYMYTDRVIPAWNYTKGNPTLTRMYRQVRVELMKVASRLDMAKLESAVRRQTDPEKSLDEDFRLAIRDRRFFEDGDAVLQLDGRDVPVHSTFICQRCPWFEGLFHGRSAGRWLAGRQASQELSSQVRIDLKHLDSGAFEYVLEHIYADAGEELFDSVVSSLEEFTDLVMDVMSIANELMLDRLSQVCQKVMGRFVTTRNIAHLLNDISPCSVTTFKDAGLEYICLQLEAMLENHLLDDLDEDLLADLDRVVRENQLAQFPTARSGRAELLLHENHPELAQDIIEERLRRIREMAFKATLKDDERKLVNGLKVKYGNSDDVATASLSVDRAQKSTTGLERNKPFSPSLRPRPSNSDLMFDMDEDQDLEGVSSPTPRPKRPNDAGKSADVDELTSSLGPRSEPVSSPVTPNLSNSVAKSQGLPSESNLKQGRPWGNSPLTTKLDLREIFQSKSPGNHSVLSAGLAAQKNKMSSPSPKPTPIKLSQKERKRQQQQQAAQAAQLAANLQSSKIAWDRSGNDIREPPWKFVSDRNQGHVQLGERSDSLPPVTGAKLLVAGETSVSSVQRRALSPDTRFAGQSRSTNGSTANLPAPQRASSFSATASRAIPQNSKQHLVPHSKTYITPPKREEPLLGVSMADIIGQQQREQEIVKEAVAKRSLQEIQQEQAFQEWWDAESQRMQEEEARRLKREQEKAGKDDRKRRNRRGGKGGGATPAHVTDRGTNPSKGASGSHKRNGTPAAIVR